MQAIARAKKVRKWKIMCLVNRTLAARGPMQTRLSSANMLCRCAMRYVDIRRDILLFTNRGDASNDQKSSYDDHVFCTPSFEQKRSRQANFNDCLMYSRTMISSENQAFSRYRILYALRKRKGLWASIELKTLRTDQEFMREDRSWGSGFDKD
jgi:hypothetical protein